MERQSNPIQNLSLPFVRLISLEIHYLLLVLQKAVKMLIDNVDKVPVSLFPYWYLFSPSMKINRENKGRIVAN